MRRLYSGSEIGKDPPDGPPTGTAIQWKAEIPKVVLWDGPTCYTLTYAIYMAAHIGSRSAPT